MPYGRSPVAKTLTSFVVAATMMVPAMVLEAPIAHGACGPAYEFIGARESGELPQGGSEDYGPSRGMGNRWR